MESADPPQFRGTLSLSGNGVPLADYQIEIDVPPDSLTGLPTVREVGGAVPRTAERHVSADGSLCVMLPDAYWLDRPGGMSLVEFIDGPLRGYLAGQSLVAMGEVWPAGEWAHGIVGKVQFYARELGATSIGKLRRLLKLASRPETPRRWDCPCGSKLQVGRCHGPKVDRIRSRIPPALLAGALDELISIDAAAQDSDRIREGGDRA